MKEENNEFHTQEDSNFPSLDRQSTDLNNPYNSENLDNESGSEFKDITEQDIENNLRNNDPSQGFETEIDTTDTAFAPTISKTFSVLSLVPELQPSDY
jgi:hypothetical protein